MRSYYNTITLQTEDLRNLTSVQVERCYDEGKLASLMDVQTFRNLKRVVVTGCGDSYSAAGAMLSTFRLHSGLSRVDAPDPMDFCRFYSKEEVTCGYDEDQVLVIAVSASGGSTRISEILEKANKMGVHSMLISNNPASSGAKMAKHMYYVETPEGCNSPGFRSYFASLVALSALSAYIGLVQEHIGRNRFEEIRDSIQPHMMAFMEQFDRIDREMIALAQSWKNYTKFEIIGDHDAAFSAQFVEEKFIECAGVHTVHVDSEDWCHINFFLREPQTIGTVFVTARDSASFDRVIYSIRSAVQVGRPVLVVTDAEEGLIPRGAAVCRIPKAKEGWLNVLTDFIPGSLLGSYVAECAGKLFFGGKYDYRTQTWHSDS